MCRLQTKGFATGQLVDTQKAQVAQMQATVKADQAVIENAQVNLGYTKLIAPIDGVTGIRQIDEGNIIHPTDTNGLVDLTQIQPISLIFTLPQATFPEIQQEMAKGPVKVLAYSQDDKTRLDEGELLLIDNQINQTTGTIRLRRNLSERAAPALARRAGQCAVAAQDRTRRTDHRRRRRATGPERLLRLRHHAGPVGPGAPGHRSRRSARGRR